MCDGLQYGKKNGMQPKPFLTLWDCTVLRVGFLDGAMISVYCWILGRVMNSTLNSRHGILLGLLAMGIALPLFIDAVPQDPRYHSFADTRAFRGIPNFFNVATNGFFFWWVA